MGDLLVALYRLEDLKTSPSGIVIRRPFAAEKHEVATWVDERFGTGWRGEAEIALSQVPPTCFLALDEEKRLLGFACYDSSWKGFFGPTGVEESARGRGIGTALARRALSAMREAGYAYAVIGASGADEFYRATFGAQPIVDSDPGPYEGRLQSK